MSVSGPAAVVDCSWFQVQLPFEFMKDLAKQHGVWLPLSEFAESGMAQGKLYIITTAQGIIDFLNQKGVVPAAASNKTGQKLAVHRARAELRAAFLQWEQAHLRLPQQIASEYSIGCLILLARLGLCGVQQAHQWRNASSIPLSMILLSTTAATFLFPGGVSARHVALSPYVMLHEFEYDGVMRSFFVHENPKHLFQNLPSILRLLPDVERKLGTLRLVGELAGLAGLAAVVNGGISAFLKPSPISSSSYYIRGGVGASPVMLALQVLMSEAAPADEYILGWKIPPWTAWVRELGFITFTNPDAHFSANISGVIAGILRVHVAAPALKALMSKPTRNFGSGTTSGRPIRNKWWQKLRPAMTQILMAAVASGVHVIRWKETLRRQRAASLPRIAC